MTDEKSDLSVKDKKEIDSRGSGESIGDSGVKPRRNLNTTIQSAEPEATKKGREVNKKLSRVKGGDST